MIDTASSQEPRKLGLFMVFIAWILFIAMLTVIFNIWLDRQNNPNRDVKGFISSEGIKEIRLYSNRHNHYVVGGEINGQKVVLIVDTGSTDVAIPGFLQKQLGLKKGVQLQVATANGIVKAYSTKLKTIKIGPIELHNVSASINPSIKSEEVLLGMSVLKHLEISQKEGQLILRQHP